MQFAKKFLPQIDSTSSFNLGELIIFLRVLRVRASPVKDKCSLFPREKIAQWMETSLDDATDPWGVKVERVEM